MIGEDDETKIVGMGKEDCGGWNGKGWDEMRMGTNCDDEMSDGLHIARSRRSDPFAYSLICLRSDILDTNQCQTFFFFDMFKLSFFLEILPNRYLHLPTLSTYTWLFSLMRN